jgi:aminomethyltransferase
MMNADVKRTRLHGWHVQNGANMAQFGQYDMPLWYPSGAKKEHLAVLSDAGMFDTSHMSICMIGGGESFELLQTCFSKNLTACVGKIQAPLTPGKSVYGVFLNAGAEVIDDAIVFQLDDTDYLVVVNAGMGGIVGAHLSSHAAGKDVTVTDLTDQVGKLDVQGPQSAKIISRILREPDRVFDRMPYFSFKGHFDSASPLADAVRLTDGTPLLLSRTGYTGEFGFEIFVAPEKFTDLWGLLLDAGRSFGMLACGLAARDSLRAGAVLPLSHQDIGPWPFKNNPWPFALAYTADNSGFTKDFVGADVLQKSSYHEHTFAFAGYDLRKVSTGETAEVHIEGGPAIGRVLTCATDMAIGRLDGNIFSICSPDIPPDFKPRGLCCGFIKVNRPINAGETVILKDNHRSVKVEIVKDIRPDRTARKPLANFL